MASRQQHILVLYNAPTVPAEHPYAESEREVVDTADVVVNSLEAAGFRVSRLAIGADPLPLVRALEQDRPNAVFNLYEGIAECGMTEAYCVGLLEWFSVPFTGCPLQSVVLARDKSRAKLLFRAAGLPTPDFQVVANLPIPSCRLRWPVILKPASEDASVGLDQGSVVKDQEGFARRAQRLLEQFHAPVLAEQFIAGRELNVALIEDPELRVLPISEIVFSDQLDWPIVTYDAKWAYGSLDDRNTTPCCPASVAPALAERITAIARRAFRLMGCRDYARCDFRVSAHGEPFLLEINPNPDYSAVAGFARSLRAAGISHEQFTVQLARRALARETA
jgi:D-alanine-D-alanine ligase